MSFRADTTVRRLWLPVTAGSLPHGANNTINVVFSPPTGWRQFTVAAVYTNNPGGTFADHAWTQLTWLAQVPGSAIAIGQAPAGPSPVALNNLTTVVDLVSRGSMVPGPVPTELYGAGVQLSLQRLGLDANDTYTGTITLLALVVNLA